MLILSIPLVALITFGCSLILHRLLSSRLFFLFIAVCLLAPLGLLGLLLKESLSHILLSPITVDAFSVSLTFEASFITLLVSCALQLGALIGLFTSRQFPSSLWTWSVLFPLFCEQTLLFCQTSRFKVILLAFLMLVLFYFSQIRLKQPQLREACASLLAKTFFVFNLWFLLIFIFPSLPSFYFCLPALWHISLLNTPQEKFHIVSQLPHPFKRLWHHTFYLSSLIFIATSHPQTIISHSLALGAVGSFIGISLLFTLAERHLSPHKYFSSFAFNSMAALGVCCLAPWNMCCFFTGLILFIVWQEFSLLKTDPAEKPSSSLRPSQLLLAEKKLTAFLFKFFSKSSQLLLFLSKELPKTLILRLVQLIIYVFFLVSRLFSPADTQKALALLLAGLILTLLYEIKL